MNDKLKTVLQVAEAIGVKAFPIIAAPVAVAHKIAEHKGKDSDDYLDAAEVAIKVIEAKKGEIADEAQFRAGAVMVRTGLQMIHGSLKHDDAEA